MEGHGGGVQGQRRRRARLTRVMCCLAGVRDEVTCAVAMLTNRRRRAYALPATQRHTPTFTPTSTSAGAPEPFGAAAATGPAPTQVGAWALSVPLAGRRRTVRRTCSFAASLPQWLPGASSHAAERRPTAADPACRRLPDVLEHEVRSERAASQGRHVCQPCDICGWVAVRGAELGGWYAGRRWAADHAHACAAAPMHKCTRPRRPCCCGCLPYPRCCTCRRVHQCRRP